MIQLYFCASQIEKCAPPASCASPAPAMMLMIRSLNYKFPCTDRPQSSRNCVLVCTREIECILRVKNTAIQGCNQGMRPNAAKCGYNSKTKSYISNQANHEKDTLYL